MDKAKFIKNSVLLAVLAGLAFGLIRVRAGTAKTDCFSGTGDDAVSACSFLINWPVGGDKDEALYRRSRLYSASSDWKAEKADLQRILSGGMAGLAKGRQAQVYTALAAVSARLQDEASVVKYSRLAVDSGSSDPGIYLAVADAFLDGKQYSQAADILLKAPIPADQKDHPYYDALAAAYSGMGNYAGAYEALGTALRNVKAPRPVLAATAKQMGLVCFELKRYDEAKLYLGYAVKAGADCPECPLLLTTINGSLSD